MLNTVKDGTGQGHSARVDAENRLHSATVSRSERDAAIDDGRYFIMSTKIITLTDALLTPLAYVKNNDSSRDLFIDIAFIWSGASTGGSGSFSISTWTNIDDTSTIVSEAKPLTAGNSRIGHPGVFVGDTFLGESNDTLIAGFNFIEVPKLPTEREEFEPRAILPNGNSTAFAITPPTGNTSMDVSIVLGFYYLDVNLPK